MRNIQKNRTVTGAGSWSKSAADEPVHNMQGPYWGGSDGILERILLEMGTKGRGAAGSPGSLAHPYFDGICRFAGKVFLSGRVIGQGFPVGALEGVAPLPRPSQDALRGLPLASLSPGPGYNRLGIQDQKREHPLPQHLPKALQLKISALNRAIFLQDGDQAASAYEDVLAVEPAFSLRDPVQFQLARLLEKGGHAEMALTAHTIGLQEKAILGIDRQDALLAAGKLAARLGRVDQAFVHLEQYLATDPPDEGRQEAMALMKQAHGREVGASPPSPQDPSTEKLPALDSSEEEGGRYSPEDRVPLAEQSQFAKLPSDSLPEPEKLPSERERRQHRKLATPDPDRLTPETAVARKAPPTPPDPLEERISSGETVQRFRTPPPPAPDEETPEQRYNRLRDGEFALLLPLGKKIHLPAVADLVAHEQNLNEEDARKRIMRQKGLLYDELKVHDVLSLKEGVDHCGQALLFVNIPRTLRPVERSFVFSAEFKPQGLRMETSDGLKRLRWDDIRLISCGMLEGQVVMTLIGLHPTVEYELAGDRFSFAPFRAPEEGDETGLAGLLEVLRNHCRHAVISHTCLRLLEKKSRSPQVFATREEYTAYTLYVLFSHFGEVVDADELLHLHQAHSDW